MKNFLPHTDLTNPQAYHNMINQNIIVVARPYDRQYCGKIKNTVFGFDVVFTEKGKYLLEDCYGNVVYIGQWSNKDRVFSLIDSNDFLLCESLNEFRDLIRKHFKRK